jgi:hypothetical protein
MSGTELISKSNRLVGIAMSGFGTDADARRSLEAGFSQHPWMEKLDAVLKRERPCARRLGISVETLTI